MPHKRVTVRDIATELGIGVGTVSNALNGRQGEVSGETIEKVRAAAKRLGYSRNRTASALRTGRQGAVSLYVPAPVRALSFYMEFTLGVSEVADESDLDLVLVTGNSERGSTLPVDGGVVVDWLPGQHGPRRLAQLDVPVVVAGDVPSPDHLPDVVVRVDYATLVDRMVTAALASGGTKVAMLAPDRTFSSDWSVSIVRGVEQACERADVPMILEPIPVASNQRAVSRAARRLLEEHAPDVVVFGPQRTAGMVALEMGWGGPNSAVPYVISCAGDPVSELGVPSLTCIDTAAHDFGRRCGAELVKLIGNAGSTNAGVAEGESKPLYLAQQAKIQWADHWDAVSE